MDRQLCSARKLTAWRWWWRTRRRSGGEQATGRFAFTHTAIDTLLARRRRRCYGSSPLAQLAEHPEGPRNMVWCWRPQTSHLTCSPNAWIASTVASLYVEVTTKCGNFTFAGQAAERTIEHTAARYCPYGVLKACRTPPGRRNKMLRRGIH